MGRSETSEPKEIWKLKEIAKWDDDPGAKKSAISELSTRGESGLISLEEILAVTAHEEIRNACIDAIKAIREKNEKANTQRKEEPDNAESNKELSLADLPP
ncbi:MAG: hypothetical protein ACREBU_00975 [Nitrososphaera sp.]